MKLKRKTTHVKIFYKDGSVYNLRRALVHGCRTPSKLRIEVRSATTHSYIDDSNSEIMCKSYQLSKYSINKERIEKVEQTYRDGSISVVFDQENGLKLDHFMGML